MKGSCTTLLGAREYFAGIADPALLQATPFTPMVALVNDPQSPDNAYFMPSTGQLRFGLFGSRSSARSASIVTHEFGHAITDSICKLGRAKVRNTESRGLSEGYSDYFAASSLDDPGSALSSPTTRTGPGIAPIRTWTVRIRIHR